MGKPMVARKQSWDMPARSCRNTKCQQNRSLYEQYAYFLSACRN
jgi:hypothetical protein